MPTDPMPTDAVETTRKRLSRAAEDLDTNLIAGLVSDSADRFGVVPYWERVCVPLLAASPGREPTEIAVEHALSEGIRVGLDVHRRHPRRPYAPDGVLLAGAEQELHCLGLHALAAARRELRRGSLLLGPALPWAGLAGAVYRARPHSVVVWAQTPVTGRTYRLIRFARDFPSVRVLAAGPGWIEPLPSSIIRLVGLAEAVRVC
ncbi:transcriptional regulator [Micromonospora sp. SH-82]|uniref:transcriptional regulator n=1 Tax=Micromonospora sp. SH-82 TaxID=3132938 RepID=UPI003EC13251